MSGFSYFIFMKQISGFCPILISVRLRFFPFCDLKAIYKTRTWTAVR